MRRRSRRRKNDPGGAQDRWLITYADLITLLLIFFVVMFAMSKIDADKYDSLSQTLQLTFRNGDSLLDKGTSIAGEPDRGDRSAVSQADRQETGYMPTELDLAFRKQEEDLRRLKHVIEDYVKEHQLDQMVFVSDTPKGIAIRLSDQFLFDLGKADLKAGSAPTLAKLASLFAQLDTTISIEGHTDDLPIQPGGTYTDNWGLSAARALSVLRHFVDEERLDAKQFQIAGYADTHPIASNDNEANRQKNRRVEIVVLRKLMQ